MAQNTYISLFKKYWNRFNKTAFYKVLRDTVIGFQRDNPMLYGASIAFYTIFSMPPILVFVVFIAQLFFQQKNVEGALYEYIESFVGSESAQQIQNILSNVQLDYTGILSQTFAVVSLIISATTVFVNMQYALNAIWGVRAKPERGWLKFIIDRMFSFMIVASLGLLLLGALLVNVASSLFQNFLSKIFSEYTLYLTQAISLVLLIALVTLVFALVFKLLPDAFIRWRDVWVGALVTSLLFIAGKQLIGIYLTQSSTASTYGAASSLVFLLIWIYYSTVIFLVGAEFTKAYSQCVGQEIRPKKNAVKVIRQEIEHEVPDSEEEKA